MTVIMSAPIISFSNSLNFSVTVYDSFSEATQDGTNYIGTLTSIAIVPANTTVSVRLKRPASVLIVSNATSNAPLARLTYLSGISTGPYGVGQANVNAMTQTMDFITFINNNQNDPLTVAFRDLWKDSSKPQVKPVNDFFTQHPIYASCTFATYMMGIAYTAEQPEAKSKPSTQALYSLKTLVQLLGGTWPVSLPDIVVTSFTCNTTNNDVLAIRAGIDLKKLPAQSDDALQFFGSLFTVQQLQMALTINYAFKSGNVGTHLSISLDAMHVPFGGSAVLAINKPTATIDINPLFKFVIFEVTGNVPFNIFGKQFEADVSMVIDNTEANFSVVIEGDHSSLPAPPTMKGVHFDTFGVGIGVIFEPPSAAIGLSGQLHIGDSGSGPLTVLDDDNFVVVCQMIEDVPTPLYVSFYVSQMSLEDVFTIFTNSQCPVDVPVLFTDLSFQWSANPMEPVVLPDGSLSNMDYGFSAVASIFDIKFYGDVEIDLTKGLTASIQMAPLKLGSIFSIIGNGTGFSVKVDTSGNPIKNNQLVTTAAQKKAIEDATTKNLVQSGGAVLELQTSASPFLHLNGTVSLFESGSVNLDADITASGITFDVDFGGLLTSKMSCTLSDSQNLSAAFEYGINDTISLPSLSGVGLGSLHLQATADANFALSTSSSDIILQVWGSFDFEGATCSFGKFTVDVHIQSISDLLSSILNNIEQNAGQVFNSLLSSAVAWAGKVEQDIITGIESVADVLQKAFNQDAGEVTSTMKEAGFGAGEIAGGLHSAFGMAPLDIAQLLQQNGFVGGLAASALQSVVGNDAAPIVSALKDVYGWVPNQIIDALGHIGFNTNDISRALGILGGLPIQ
ncbi:uncharacterized protein CCOS01_00410 [Colletotrichum costaricense]|uniref:Uncharacterized protein n=1 Tax=Colletotrichum costaricense TaxID=1209916 RepID=A0AAI9ZAM5_9PEZI|nr:uncharacterized protein CCOS01_00410 [Colletotrichum costaricense]KAK1539096.1 hypothetical protein CCOS01_00410 [Colletotrichum costaricense]